MIKSFFIFILLLGNMSFAVELTGFPTITDGDTLKINGEKIRLDGIDAPESEQRCLNKNGANYQCGKLATKFLENVINQNEVKCKTTSKDRYGRYIGTCFLNNINLNKMMVLNGHALAYRQYSKRYIEVEKTAEIAQAGMWQGIFVKPWSWRKGERLSQEKQSNTKECLIKGNISNSGKIYHTPQSQWYSRTKINETKGERWFCTEAEAIAAGWRAPKK